MSIFTNLLMAAGVAFVALLVQRATGGVYEAEPNSMVGQTVLITGGITGGKSLGVFLTVEQGANTQVYLASTKDTIVGGGYYSGMKLENLGDFATDPDVANQLWKQSEDISGVTFSF